MTDLAQDSVGVLVKPGLVAVQDGPDVVFAARGAQVGPLIDHQQLITLSQKSRTRKWPSLDAES